MKMKVFVFCLSESMENKEKFEEEVNAFLNDQPAKAVMHITQSADNGILLITIFYI